MPKCLDIPAWQLATAKEVIAFIEGKNKRASPPGSLLVIRSKLTQVDVYAYLRARFGWPNGFQNFLRKDDSDNLIHWDFNVRASDVDVYIQGRMRDVSIMVSEPMTDNDWKALILALKADFGRIGHDKSNMLRSFEKYVVFQNKFVTLAELCADLHSSVVDIQESDRTLPRLGDDGEAEDLKRKLNSIANRSTSLYGDCLKLRLLTPIMGEAFLNMIILTFCKDEVRNDKVRYEAFVREKIPERLALLRENCDGFTRAVDSTSECYKDFLRVMNARNFVLHGNVDPVRERIETVYFEGKRPIFADNGDHILKLFDHLEKIYDPQAVLKDYEAVHLFLLEVQSMLDPNYQAFFEQVIDDPYPGYEVKKKRVTKILPSHNAAMFFQGERFDDDLEVDW